MTYGYHDPFTEDEDMGESSESKRESMAKNLRKYDAMPFHAIASVMNMTEEEVERVCQQDDARELNLHDERCERGPEEPEPETCGICEAIPGNAPDSHGTRDVPLRTVGSAAWWQGTDAERAVVLRREGWAYEQIARKLECETGRVRAWCEASAVLREAADAAAPTPHELEPGIYRTELTAEDTQGDGVVAVPTAEPTATGNDDKAVAPTSREPSPAVPGQDCDCEEPDRTHFPSYAEGEIQRYYCRDCGGRLPEVRDLPSPLDKAPNDLGDVVCEAKRLAAEDDDFDELELSDFMKEIRDDVRERLKKILTDVQHTRTKARQCDWTGTIRWLGRAKTNVDELLLFVEDVRAEHGEPETARHLLGVGRTEKRS